MTLNIAIGPILLGNPGLVNSYHHWNDRLDAIDITYGGDPSGTGIQYGALHPDQYYGRVLQAMSEGQAGSIAFLQSIVPKP